MGILFVLFVAYPCLVVKCNIVFIFSFFFGMDLIRPFPNCVVLEIRSINGSDLDLVGMEDHLSLLGSSSSLWLTQANRPRSPHRLKLIESLTLMRLSFCIYIERYMHCSK